MDGGERAAVRAMSPREQADWLEGVLEVERARLGLPGAAEQAAEEQIAMDPASSTIPRTDAGSGDRCPGCYRGWLTIRQSRQYGLVQVQYLACDNPSCQAKFRRDTPRSAIQPRKKRAT